MNAFIKALPAVVLFSLPIAAVAQSSDTDYCKALVAKYEQYLDMDSKRGQQPSVWMSAVASRGARQAIPPAFRRSRRRSRTPSSPCRRAAEHARMQRPGPPQVDSSPLAEVPMKRTIIAASIAVLPFLLGVSPVHAEQPEAQSNIDASKMPEVQGRWSSAAPARRQGPTPRTRRSRRCPDFMEEELSERPSDDHDHDSGCASPRYGLRSRGADPINLPV